MYRLHNEGMEAKIDWLVRNRNLLQRKLVISPWDNNGMLCYRYLHDKWGKDAVVVDDEISKYNHNVLPRNSIEPPEDYTYLLFCMSGFSYPQYLSSKGVPDENVFILKGDPLFSQDCLIKCLALEGVQTVLDVGGGKGNHSNIFAEYGKDVTLIDAGFTCSPREKKYKLIQDDFETHQFSESYDLVWCSQILEHQLNVGNFVKKLFSCAKPGKYVAISVPGEVQPDGGYITEGHVSLWNLGELINVIIHCGQSCTHAMGKTYPNNKSTVSVIVPNEPFDLGGDYRAFTKTRIYFPEGIDLGRTRFGGVYFNGNIDRVNWED